MRGKELSRIEGFSDAVFGFSLTLLVVSLEVPNNFEDLRRTLEGFPAFAITFAIVIWIWCEHYAFFRRFALHDPLTIFLNSVLLFTVMFFVYPLKFTFTGLAKSWFNMGPGIEGMTPGDARLLMIVYGVGFVAVFTVFSLLHWNALRQREILQLTPLETFDAHAATRSHLLSVAVGTISILLAVTLPARLVGLSGFFYSSLGLVHAIHGWRVGRARHQLEIAP